MVYFTNATNHIITSPAGITARWIKRNPPSHIYDGIDYSYSGNTRFIELQEVTVVDPTYSIWSDVQNNTSGGTLTPFGNTSNIPYGGSQAYTLTINGTYSVIVDYYDARGAGPYNANYPPIVVFTGQGPLATGDTPITVDPVYTFNNISHNYVLRANFFLTPSSSHFIRTNTSTGGTISVSFPATQPIVGISWVFTASNTVTVPVTINATSGYYIKEVRLDTHDITGEVTYTTMSGPYPVIGTYPLPPSTLDNTVTAVFERIPLTITATAGPGGSVSPLGAVTVPYGEDWTFTITPAPGYAIDEVQRGPALSPGPGLATVIQEFSGVVENQVLHVTFMQSTYSNYTITATTNAGGRLIPTGLHPDTDPDQTPIINASRGVLVPDGANQSFKIIPDPGFIIRDVIVNGISRGTIDNFTFDEVRSDNTIIVVFEAIDPTQLLGERAPQTGDDRNPVLPVFMIALGILALTGLVFYRRRLKKDKK